MLHQNQVTAAAVAAGAPPAIALFEPDAPVYALGRRAQGVDGRARIAGSIAACAARQIAIVDVDRGGLGTLHAPGQIVAFLAVACPRWQARELCAELLHGIADLARDSGVDARCDLADDVGVWSPRGKLASLGLRLRDDVALHGVAINCAVDRGLGQGLVLCGKPLIALDNLAAEPDGAELDLAPWASKLAARWQLAPADGTAQQTPR